MADVGIGPVFTGLIVYRNPQYRYSLFYPEGWYQVDLAVEAGQAVAFRPSADDPITSLTVEARNLGTSVSADDLPTLRRGFLAGLRKLRRSAIEHHEDYAVGDLIGLEARHTFQQGATRRKRWVRLLYEGSTQVCLVAQGATIEKFEYWLPMFNEAMHTFRFGDWWVDATGREWLTSLDVAEESELDAESGRQN